MKHLSLDDFHLFERIALLGSLSAAARERDVPVSQISRALARMEAACGARLLRRSTHGMTLTAEGDTFLDYAQRMTATQDEMEGEFAARTDGIKGTVRVAASTVIAHHLLLPSLAELGRRYPHLCVELDVSDRTADLARDGIDIALRTAANLPDSVVARRIGTMSRALYAAPEYLATAGTPRSMDDLRQHALVTTTSAPSHNQWPFAERGRRVVLTVKGRWRGSDTNTVAGMVAAGLGIGRLASVVAAPLVRQGRLVAVLADVVETEAAPLYAVTLGTRHRLPKIKACLAFWTDWFAAVAEMR